MAAKLSRATILGDMRAAGWSTSQIEARTGISRQTQWAIRTGKTSGRSYDTVLREARRTGTKPPPKTVRPVPSYRTFRVHDLAAKIAETGLWGRNEPDIEELVAEIGERAAERLLKEQYESTVKYQQGSIQPGNRRWVHRENRWDRLVRGSDEYVFDDSRDQWFYYHGKK